MSNSSTDSVLGGIPANALSVSARPLRVLVLDDDPQVAELQRIYLEEMGYAAEVAPNVQTAYKSIERSAPHLLIVDFRLAEAITGLDFYRALCNRGLSIPAILVTALGYEEVLIEAMRLGMRGFVLKTPTYWRDFKETVERVMRQRLMELDALETRAAKESEAKVEAALDAASVGYWRWDSETGVFGASRAFRALVRVESEQPLTSRDDFLNLVVSEDRPRLESLIEAARRSTQSHQGEFRVETASGEMRWFVLRCATPPGTPGVVTGAISDITAQKEAEGQVNQSYREIQSLNHQLQASMIETHHRVKNSLQIVNSLVNMELRRAENFTAQDLRKLSAHIQAFAALHDILANQSKELATNYCATSFVGAHEVMAELLEILGTLSEGRLVVDRLAAVWVSARQSAALGLLLNELVSNAIKHGQGPIHLRLECDGGWCSLAVSNEGSAFPQNFNSEDTTRTGLKLMNTIARMELGSELEFLNTDRGALAQVAFELPQSAGAPRSSTGEYAALSQTSTDKKAPSSAPVTSGLSLD